MQREKRETKTMCFLFLLCVCFSLGLPDSPQENSSRKGCSLNSSGLMGCSKKIVENPRNSYDFLWASRTVLNQNIVCFCFYPRVKIIRKTWSVNSARKDRKPCCGGFWSSRLQTIIRSSSWSVIENSKQTKTYLRSFLEPFTLNALLFGLCYQSR